MITAEDLSDVTLKGRTESFVFAMLSDLLFRCVQRRAGQSGTATVMAELTEATDLVAHYDAELFRLYVRDKTTGEEVEGTSEFASTIGGCAHRYMTLMGY